MPYPLDRVDEGGRSGESDVQATVISHCPGCNHPWSIHSDTGCNVGMWATPQERCPCKRPMPMLPGEGIDDAEVRLGKLSSDEWRRLAHGSLVVERLQQMLAEHIDLVTRDLGELAGWITDIKEFLQELAETEPAAEINALSLARVEEIVAEMSQAIASAGTIWSPIRDVSQT